LWFGPLGKSLNPNLALEGILVAESAMPQIQLPVFPAGSQNINGDLAFERRDHQVTYFNGHLPVFTHAADDLSSFRFFTTQLIVNGSATQGEIVQAFGVSLTTVKRCVKRYRQGGAKALFAPPARRSGTKLNAERLAQAQQLLDEGFGVPEISRQLGVLASTLHKAIAHGRLRGNKKKSLAPMRGPKAALKPSGW
jgi:transposase